MPGKERRTVINTAHSKEQPSKMSSVYIFGPIHLYGEDHLPIYKKLTKLAQKYFERIVCTYPDFWDSQETPKEFYDRTYNTITKCDFFIAEVTSPSMGVGMELQMAQEHNIPCIAICKEGTSVSTMVKGNSSVKEIIYYKNWQDLSKKLDESLRSLQDVTKKSGDAAVN